MAMSLKFSSRLLLLCVAAAALLAGEPSTLGMAAGWEWSLPLVDPPLGSMHGGMSTRRVHFEYNQESSTQV